MFRKSLAAMCVPLFVTVTAAATPAFADTPTSGQSAGQLGASEKATLGRTFSDLRAVDRYSLNLSDMAAAKAKSDLVKSYAREMATANRSADEKLQAVAQKRGIDVGPLDTQTEAGKSLQDRINGETALLNSLQGDAWDKEYMVLVTNAQQSVINALQARKALSGDPELKQVFNDMTNAVEGRLTKAQDIMAKVYGNEI
jgi:predicted outer membrane protein